MSSPAPTSMLPILKLRVDLKPRQIEILKNRDIQELIKYAYTNDHLNQADVLKLEGKRIIYQTAFLAFLVGKQDAAEESGIDYWAIEKNDLPFLESIQQSFTKDYFKLINQLETDVLTGISREQIKKYLGRTAVIIQMLVWTSYNRGKVALWDDEIFGGILRATRSQYLFNVTHEFTGKKDPRFEAQKYKYLNQFMFRTETDGLVCADCAPLSGMLNTNPMNLPQPPLHVNCRCMIVAIPTVKVLSKQERFRKTFAEEKIRPKSDIKQYPPSIQETFDMNYDKALLEWSPEITMLSREEYALLIAWKLTNILRRVE